MTGRLWTLWSRIETAVREKWPLRAVFYACAAAAILLTWLFTDGQSVDFVYSEF